MRRPLGLVLGLGLVLTACGSGGSPADKAVSATEGHLGDVRSGQLSLRLLASVADAAPGRGAGFELEGPFAVGEEVGSLPVANLEYTRITGATRRSTRFISTGSRAFAEVDGRIVPLADRDVQDMRVRGGKDAGKGGLDGLDLSAWFSGGKLSEGSAIEGVATERVTGNVDPVAALNDLLTLSLRFGASDQDAPQKLSGEAADRVRRAVSSATGEMLTGKDDRLLRHLQVRIDIKPDTDQEKLGEALGNLTGTLLQFSLDVTNVNEPVEVAEPR
jgi:hypothetical protein